MSRDLQIAFGNRPNPDANGRGGPSEQKKSRGVASLVLGVPIPDRVKGQPGKGPTKVTQERVQPQAESPETATAGARRPGATRAPAPPPARSVAARHRAPLLPGPPPDALTPNTPLPRPQAHQP
ncbi:MAG: hypothetical protein R3E96_09730 [Planctomycetota bacterium]